uniref:Uncharacterized protein n=1 Tax=Rhizophora mucronata TaxID=61149 RepID=A0A2P2NHF1_RHIMU
MTKSESRVSLVGKQHLLVLYHMGCLLGLIK